jgi:sec-independent protein translocase protein TatB
MFNIGSGEIALIAVVALLILGPSRLPELARGIGKFMREFRRQTDEVRGVVEREFYKMDEPPLQIRPAQDTFAHGQPVDDQHDEFGRLKTPPVPEGMANGPPALNAELNAEKNADPDALPVPPEHVASQLTAGMPAPQAASSSPEAAAKEPSSPSAAPEPKS